MEMSGGKDHINNRLMPQVEVDHNGTSENPLKPSGVACIDPRDQAAQVPSNMRGQPLTTQSLAGMLVHAHLMCLCSLFVPECGADCRTPPLFLYFLNVLGVRPLWDALKFTRFRSCSFGVPRALAFLKSLS